MEMGAKQIQAKIRGRNKRCVHTEPARESGPQNGSLNRFSTEERRQVNAFSDATLHRGRARLDGDTIGTATDRVALLLDEMIND
jgi:hypothetical protein